MGKKKPKYWNNGKIPADLFFEILTQDDKSLLVKSGRLSKSNIEKAWDKIYDEFFELRNDRKLTLILKTQERIRKLVHKIEVVKNVLKVLMILDLPERFLIDVSKSLKKINIVIDPKISVPSQIKNLQDFKLSHWEAELKIEKDNLKELCKGQKTTYETGLVTIENVLGRPTGDNLTLRKYCALEKSAKEISNKRQQQNKK